MSWRPTNCRKILAFPWSAWTNRAGNWWTKCGRRLRGSRGSCAIGNLAVVRLRRKSRNPRFVPLSLLDQRAPIMRLEARREIVTSGPPIIRSLFGSWAKTGKVLTKGRGTEPPPTRTTSRSRLRPASGMLSHERSGTEPPPTRTTSRSRLRPASGMLSHERSGDRAPSYTHNESEPAPSGERDAFLRKVGGQSPLLHAQRVGAGSVRRAGCFLTKGRGTEPPPTRTTSRSRLRPASGMLSYERSGDRAPSYTHNESEPAPSGERDAFSRKVGGQSPLLHAQRVGAGSVRRAGCFLTKGRGTEPPPTRTTSRSRLRPAVGMLTNLGP